MRIALFHNVPSGGAKRAIFEWTRRLSAHHQIDAYTLSSADHGFCDIRPFVVRHVEQPFAASVLFPSPFGRLSQFQRWRDLGRLAVVGKRIAAAMDDGGYDLVFAHTCQFTFFPAPLLFVRRPAVYYLHEPFGRGLAPAPSRTLPSARYRRAIDHVDPMIWLYRRGLDRWHARGVSSSARFLANSRYTASCMRSAYGLAAAVCAPGVDLEQFCPLAHVVKGEHLIAVGELSPRKGFDFLIEALGLVPPTRRPPLRLACNSVVAAERRHIESLARERGVVLDIMVGLDTRQLAREYNEARLCAVAAINEPFGLVALEAMACGTPVVGVLDGGVPESVIDGHTGRLAERRPDAFAEALETLLAEPARLEALGRNARAHVAQDWGWERSVIELERHLQLAAAGGDDAEDGCERS